MNTNNSSKPKLPAYIEYIYGDIYTDPAKCMAQDSTFLCYLKTFLQYKTLVNAVSQELRQNQSVLQFGITNGNQIDEAAMAIGAYGQYDIVDINPLQVSRANEKYWKVYQCLKIFKQDAANLNLKGSYDVVICFMLLSEVPSATKTKIINNALKMVKPGGKVVFVDWHTPLFWHPLRYLVRMYNRLYHPFVERLWDRDIDTFAAPETRAQFMWYKNTYFGRMFQKTVAVRKDTPSKAEGNFVDGQPFASVDF